MESKYWRFFVTDKNERNDRFCKNLKRDTLTLGYYSRSPFPPCREGDRLTSSTLIPPIPSHSRHGCDDGYGKVPELVWAITRAVPFLSTEADPIRGQINQF